MHTNLADLEIITATIPAGQTVSVPVELAQWPHNGDYGERRGTVLLAGYEGRKMSGAEQVAVS